MVRIRDQDLTSHVREQLTHVLAQIVADGYTIEAKQIITSARRVTYSVVFKPVPGSGKREPRTFHVELQEAH